MLKIMHNYYAIKYFKTTFLCNFDSTIIVGDTYLVFHTKHIPCKHQTPRH